MAVRTQLNRIANLLKIEPAHLLLPLSQACLQQALQAALSRLSTVDTRDLKGSHATEETLINE